MISRRDVERFRSANKGIAALAKRDLERFWGMLDLSQPERARDALLAFVPVLTATYGEAAATIAADWYDDVRGTARLRSRFRAQLADVVSEDVITKDVRYAAGHLWSPAPTAALGLLTLMVAKHSLQPGRDTVAQSTQRDPARVRWARVPSGAKTCAFCLDRASMGFTYTSQASALEFHGGCDCVAVPSFEESPSLAGYDPDAMRAEITEARELAGSSSQKDILAVLREEQGLN